MTVAEEPSPLTTLKVTDAEAPAAAFTGIVCVTDIVSEAPISSVVSPPSLSKAQEDVTV